MSTILTNANLDPAIETLELGRPREWVTASSPATGREALQALLAFSSLHEQIRQRRAREVQRGVQLSTDDVWELEQFVLDEVLQLVAERALAITGADGIAIALAEGEAIVCRASAGSIAPDAGVRLDPNSGFSGVCLRREEIVRCDDAETDARVNVQACRALGARSMVAVPLTGRHSVIGLLEAFSTECYGFNDSDVRSLNLLAELILSALKPEEEDRLAEISQQVVGRKEQPVETSPTETRDTKPEPKAQVPAESSLEQHGVAAIVRGSDQLNDSRPGLRVVLLMVFVALALGVAVWWNIQRTAKPATLTMSDAADPSAGTQRIAPSEETEQQPSAGSELPIASEDAPASNIREKLVLPQVTGIRHWSSATSSTVAIDLKDQVQYEAHRLSQPERIYFDLHDTALAPGLFGKTIEVGDELLLRIRVAQPMPGVSRVVLETKGGSNFSVSFESNPYRLLVELRQREAIAQPTTKINLFLPSPIAQPSKQLSSLNQQLSNRRADPVPLHALKFRIALDAGHGGWDLGTVGRKGLMEKDLVLDIVERLGKLVENGLDAEVIYTRNDDNYVALEKRAEIANLSRADLFVSIHANYSATSTARGVETYYTNTYSSLHARTRETDSDSGAAQNVSWTNVDIREKVQQSRRVASSVQRELYEMLKASTSGIRDRGVKEAQYVVLTGTSMPAILAEVSFVSSPTDENNLQNSAYRQQIAEALYKGISRYATESGRVKLASTSAKPTGR